VCPKKLKGGRENRKFNEKIRKRGAAFKTGKKTFPVGRNQRSKGEQETNKKTKGKRKKDRPGGGSPQEKNGWPPRFEATKTVSRAGKSQGGTSKNLHGRKGCENGSPGAGPRSLKPKRVPAETPKNPIQGGGTQRVGGKRKRKGPLKKITMRQKPIGKIGVVKNVAREEEGRPNLETRTVPIVPA